MIVLTWETWHTPNLRNRVQKKIDLQRKLSLRKRAQSKPLEAKLVKMPWPVLVELMRIVDSRRITNVATQQIEGTMTEVHDPYQAKCQGQAASQNKQNRGLRKSIEDQKNEFCVHRCSVKLVLEKIKP